MGRVIKQSLYTLMAAAFYLVTTTAAYAVQTTEQGAVELKTKITSLLEERKKIFSSMTEDADVGLVYTGEITVTPQQGYYNAVLPSISFVLPESTEIVLGQMVVNIIPDSDEQWRISMAIPNKMIVTDQGQEIIEVVFGEQKIAGIWNPKLDLYPKMDAQFKNITAKTLLPIEGSSTFEFKIAALKNFVDFNKTNTGNYSGPQKFEMQGFELVGIDKGQKINVAIDTVLSNATYIDMDLEGAANLKNIFLEMETKTQDQNTEVAKQEFSRLYGVLKNMIASATADFAIKGLRAEFQSEEDPAPAKFEIASIEYKARVDGLRNDNALIELSNSMNGLYINGVSVDMKDFIPTQTSMGIRLENIPYQSLLTKAEADISTVLDEAEKAGDDLAQKAMSELGGAYLKMLTTSGSKLRFYDTFMKSAAIDVDFSGDVQPDQNSPFSTVATLKLTIRGLDEALQKYGAMAQRGELSQEIKMAMQPMAMLQSFGQQETDKNGTAIRAYNLEVTTSGQVMLNGSDMSMMMGGLMGGAVTR